MVGWRDELTRWLAPFVERFGHKARRRMSSLTAVAGRDVDHRAANALHAGIALVALPGGAEEQAAVLVHPDVPGAAATEGPVDIALEADLGDAGRNRQSRWAPTAQKLSVP